MFCKNCNMSMILDDTDFNYKGNYDNYWICPCCFCSCLEEVRFGVIRSAVFFDTEGNEI